MENFVEINSPEQLDPDVLTAAGFNSGFDWKQTLYVHLVIGYRIDDQLVGLIAFDRNTVEHYNDVILIETATKYRQIGLGAKLIAIVMIDAFQHREFEGYVTMKSKLNGVERFYRHLGATLFGQRVIFDTLISEKVIKQYLPQGGTIQWTLHKSPQN